jgi:hypothetical protein
MLNGKVVLVLVCLEAYFAKKLDAYVQIIPEFQLVDDVKFGLCTGLGVRDEF